MKLTGLKLRGFRCYQEQIQISFDDLTAIIGRNDVGKSAVMDALSVFFGETALEKDDVSIGSEEVEIACTFSDLPRNAVVDAEFPSTFAGEYLLNRDGEMEIVQLYNGSLTKPKLIGTFARALHPTADGYSDLLSLKKSDLAARAKELGVDLSEVNKKANAPVRAAIWGHCAELVLAETLVPLDAEDAKKIWSSIAPYLPAFALFKSDRASTDQDPEAQDPLKAAIRDAIKEKEAELLKIQSFVEAEVKKIADATVEKIREMDPSLASTLSPVVTAKSGIHCFRQAFLVTTVYRLTREARA